MSRYEVPPTWPTYGPEQDFAALRAITYYREQMALQALVPPVLIGVTS